MYNLCPGDEFGNHDQQYPYAVIVNMIYAVFI